MKANKDIYYAKTISDVLYHLKSVSNLRVYGGYTGIGRYRQEHIIDLGEPSLTVRNIPELRQITKTERYLEFGCAATLSQIADIDQKKIPSVLHNAICSIGNPYTANIATIGGNICTLQHKMTCFAPLLALDAKVEIRDQNEVFLLPLSQFTQTPEATFVTKIRVPTEDWDIQIFKRVGGATITKESASFTFLAATQKNILSDVRIAFSGFISFRNRELENSLIGNKLPLSEKSVQNFCELARRYFGSYCDKSETSAPALVHAQFENLLFESLNTLT